jgi:hypothetical protein
MALVLLVFALVACEGDDPDPPGGVPGTSAPVADDGCTSDRPERLVNNGLEGFFRACATAALDSVAIANTSSAVLLVRAANANQPPQMTTDAFDQPASFKDAVVRDAVAGQCHLTSTGGPCRVPPGSRLLADGAAPVAVRVDIDPVQTGVATGAGVAAGYAESRLTTRAGRFKAGAVACAQSVRDFATPNEYIEDWVKRAFALGSCRGLVNEIDATLRTPSAPPADDAARALSAAGRYTKNLRRDFYVLSAARVIARLR